MELTPEELRFLKAELQQVGGEVVPLGIGFAGSGPPADIRLLSDDGLIDFRAPESSEGNALRFQDLKGNAVHEGLAKLDQRLTRHRGLRHVGSNGDLPPLDGLLTGRTLLVVHGTFSSGEMTFPPT